MTAPTTDPVATAPVVTEDALLNDDALIAQALTARAERNQHLIPDDPAPNAGASDPTATGTPASDQTTETPAAADSTTQPATTEVPADPAIPDPFAVLAKDAAPLTYKQHGQAKTFDGILEIPGKGALIPADKLDAVRNFIARGEANAAEVPRLLQERQQVEQLGGIPKFHEVMERNAQLNASSLHILQRVFENPRQFVNDDGSPNQGALEMLRREALVAAQEARFTVINERATQQQTFTQQTHEQEVRQSAVPSYLTANHADLHADDRAFLERKAPQYLFAVTKETTQHYGQPVGALMIDLDALNADVTHLKGLRSKVTETTTQSTAAVKAAEVAARENARRSPPPAKPAPAAARPRDPESGQWVRPKRLSPAEIMDRALANEPIGAPVLTE